MGFEFASLIISELCFRSRYPSWYGLPLRPCCLRILSSLFGLIQNQFSTIHANVVMAKPVTIIHVANIDTSIVLHRVQPFMFCYVFIYTLVQRDVNGQVSTFLCVQSRVKKKKEETNHIQCITKIGIIYNV